MSGFIAVNHLRCTGCKTCELVCSLYHFGECSPEKSAIRVIRKEKDGLVSCVPLVCQQCTSAFCIEACPNEALYREKGKNTLTIDKENCSACGLCVAACPAGCISIDDESKDVICCDLCGGEPRCVYFCHAHCLTAQDSSEAGGKGKVENIVRILEQEGLRESLPGRRAR